MFNLVHSTQEEGWRPKRAIIIIYTNPFNTQREQVGMILLSKRITATTQARRLNTKNLTKGIKNTGY